MEQIKEAYPLSWPVGYKKTRNRIRSKFKQGMDASQRFLRAEVGRLCGSYKPYLIVSTNIPIRLDGGIYSDYMNLKMEDPGVAIFFRYKEKDVTMCCDQYLTVWENVYALAKSIEAIRGMERWGVSEFMARAFTGFTALPPGGPVKKTWFQILGVNNLANARTIRDAYRELVKIYHPDVVGTGDADRFKEIQGAYEECEKAGLI